MTKIVADSKYHRFFFDSFLSTPGTTHEVYFDQPLHPKAYHLLKSPFIAPRSLVKILSYPHSVFSRPPITGTKSHKPSKTSSSTESPESDGRQCKPLDPRDIPMVVLDSQTATNDFLQFGIPLPSLLVEKS